MRPGLQVVDLDSADDENRGLALFGIGEPRLVDAEQPDEVRPPALAIFEEVRVVDEARAIGVLEIDAHREDMRLAFDPPRKVRPTPSPLWGEGWGEGV